MLTAICYTQVSMQLLENIPLAPLTTLGIGGPARYFVEARDMNDVRTAVDWVRARDLPLFILGGGSNLLVADAGFSGLVLKVAITGIEQHREGGKEIFAVGAGESWDAFVAHAVGRNCAGIECLSGIPGTVGGAPVQNVGAYGQEVAETITELRALDLSTGEVRELCNPSCQFEYRSSMFNTDARGRYVILRVSFALEPNGAPRVTYADLKKYFGEHNPTLAETRQAVLQIRLSKAMLIAEGDEDCRSAGSFFKNPVLSTAEYEALTQRAAAQGLAVPTYPALAAQRKVAAAWLVEHSGFCKGYSRGRVGLSRKHALAIVNRGGATAADVIALKDAIQYAVADQWGVQLYPEPVFLGFD
ncbi:MAG: UDP-N-acetylmuramate dehydrogenase [Terriglobales bacterium]